LVPFFEALDRNHDGMVEQKDLEELGNSIIHSIGLNQDSPHQKAIMDSYLQWWEQIRSGADIDQDDRVSKDEYIAAVEKGMLSVRPT
jgi:EF hand domain-containing protein